ncbi:MAG: GGDEF domain-containing protein [Bacilli bacterium]|nr:GGDEF domain-containing protein [Bacilli bacterium]
MRKEKEAEALKKSFRLSQAAIAQALASDFVSSFYVNCKTGSYIEYSSSEFYRSLNFPAVGDDFFSLTSNSLMNLVYVEDVDMVRTAFTPENVGKVLSVDKSFGLIFRIIVKDAPLYVEMKVTKMINDNDHIVVGFKNIDAHMKRIEAYENAKKNHLTFAGIAEALASDYVALFYVDTKNDVYKQYSSTDKFKTLGIPEEGTMFFSSPEGLMKHVHPDDLPIYFAACNKENVLNVLSKDRSFALTIRIMVEGRPYYSRIKITKMMLEDQYHVVVGISNIDDQVKREENYARSLDEVKEIAYRDPLTGVKSKHAFSEIETKINDDIEDGSVLPFSLLVCDVNGLKEVNDTYGHKVGDRYIKDACTIICKAYKHSPVYRIGGDEFVVILEGEDYDHRDEILVEVNHLIEENHLQKKESISIGMANFEKGKDKNLHEVFERADALMYARKKELKARK